MKIFEWSLITHLLITVDEDFQFRSRDTEVPDQGVNVSALTVVDGHLLTYAGFELLQKLYIRTVERENAVVVTQ